MLDKNNRNALYEYYKGMQEGFANFYLGRVIYTSISHAFVMLAKGISNVLYLVFLASIPYQLSLNPLGHRIASPNIP